MVLLVDEGGGNWRAAVIETSPPDAVVVNEPGIGVYGGIRLPTTVLSEKNLGAFKGNLGSIRAAKYDELLAEAALQCAAAASRQPGLEAATENHRIAATSDDAE